MSERTRAIVPLAIAGVIVVCWGDATVAHGVSRGDAAFVSGVTGPAIAPFAYLGAKHMVTGYDHLMFLVGVIFFLYRLGSTEYRDGERIERRFPAVPSR